MRDISNMHFSQKTPHLIEGHCHNLYFTMKRSDDVRDRWVWSIDHNGDKIADSTTPQEKKECYVEIIKISGEWVAEYNKRFQYSDENPPVKFIPLPKDFPKSFAVGSTRKINHEELTPVFPEIGLRSHNGRYPSYYSYALIVRDGNGERGVVEFSSCLADHDIRPVDNEEVNELYKERNKLVALRIELAKKQEKERQETIDFFLKFIDENGDKENGEDMFLAPEYQGDMKSRIRDYSIKKFINYKGVKLAILIDEDDDGLNFPRFNIVDGSKRFSDHTSPESIANSITLGEWNEESEKHLHRIWKIDEELNQISKKFMATMKSMLSSVAGKEIKE